MRLERSAAVLAVLLGCAAAPAPPDAARRTGDAGGEAPADRPAGSDRAVTGDGGAEDLLPATPPPTPWMSRDVGAVGVAGATTTAAGLYFVRGAGAAIGGAADAFHFLHQPITGDLQIVASVASVESANANARGGLMIRGSLDPDAPHVALLLTPSHKAVLHTRATAGAMTRDQEVMGSARLWLRIIRAGNLITAAISPNGTIWTDVGSAEIALPPQVFVGLAVTGSDAARLATGVFSGLRITAVPAPWTDSDLGDVAIPGSARIAGGTYTVSASGSDIAGASDQLTFLSQRFPGDGEISARVVSLDNSSTAAKAGLMFRNSLTAGSAHLSLLVTPAAQGTLLLARPTDGASTAIVATAQFLQLPAVWLRMARVGRLVVSLISQDGTNWLQMNRLDTAASPPLTHVGLAVTARNNTRTTRAVFENVVIKSYPPYPPAAPDGGASP